MADLLVDCSEYLVRRGQSQLMVSGGFRHNQSYTVTGSGFGTKSTAAPKKYDDFQSVPIGSTIWNNSTASGPSWSNNGGFTNSPHTTPYAANTQLRSGTPYTRNSRHRFLPTSDNGNAIAFVGQTITPKLVLDAWLYMDGSGFVGTNVNGKPIRLHQDNASGPNCGMTTQWGYSGNSGAVYPFGSVDGAGVLWGGNIWETWNGATHNVYTDDIWNRWIHLTHLINIGSGGSNEDGAAYAYLGGSGATSGIARSAATNIKPLSAAVDSWTELYIGNYYRNDSEWTGEINNYWDSVYVDWGASAWARVEIGDNATYDSCTHREIQIPTSWSDTSIGITVNRGSFAVNDTVHVHVTDNDNGHHYVGTVTIGAD